MPYTPLYIATTDITDSIARDFVNGSDARLLQWMQRADEELGALAQSLGVPITSIYTPINSRVKEYVIAYYCFILFQDVNGENEVENPENEVHLKKLLWYQERVNFLRGFITKEMLLQDASALTPAQTITTGVIWRG